MRRRSGVRLAVSLSLEADRRATLLTFLSFGLRPAIPVLIAYLVKVVVDAATAGDRGTAIGAAVGIAVAAGVSAGTIASAIEVNVRMIEASATLADRRLMTLVGALPGVAHLENPEVLDQLEVLRQERVFLSEGGDAVSLVLGAAVRAVLTAVVLLLVSPLMLLTPLLAIPSLLASRRGQRRRNAALEATAQRARLGQHLQAVAISPPGGRELRLSGLVDSVRGHRAEAVGTVDRAVTRAVAGNLVATTAAGAFFAAGYVLALLHVLGTYSQGGLSLGDVVLTVSLVTLVNLQVGQAVQFLGFLQQTAASARRLLWLEDYVERVADDARVPGPPRSAPVRLRDGLRLSGVGFRYPGSDAWALRGVDLQLPAGSVVAVVGANGAGKSTMIKLLAGLYRPSEGRVTVDGVDLADVAAADWSSRLSACFQDYSQLEFAVRQSVGAGDVPRMDDPDAVALAIREGAATEVVDVLPDGVDTLLGRSFSHGTQLSGGQWQRVALSRARMRQSPVLLVLDEPTAAIDPLAEEVLLNGYLAAARATAARTNGITLFASHRLSTARAADLIVVVDGGRVVESGDHGALMAAGGLYGDLYRRQANAYS